MKLYFAKNIRIKDTLITLDVEGEGPLTADLSKWEKLVDRIGGQQNIKKAQLSGDLLVFPNDVHVEIEDFVALAKQQKLLVSASFSAKINEHYDA